MRAEFEALAGGAGSMSWALGCLASATGWRVQAEAGWVVTTLFGCFAAHLIYARIFPVAVSWAQENSTVWFNFMQTAHAALLFCLCFSLTLIWPRRVWLIAGLVLTGIMSFPLVGFVLLVSDSLKDPLLTLEGDPSMPFIAFPFWWLAKQTWAGVFGAILGWSLWRVTRGRAATSSL